eukprot:TRINITY_DN10219_c0_g1_i1.p1 TRINITY_DN10219_c0_g1~~TRINITY_DN10219_c0_g1_i1.p1  ORF type:complete len:476 (+),score=87.25 TRINITY_DN10219_c0_g1_i1:93-1520(+)
MDSGVFSWGLNDDVRCRLLPSNLCQAQLGLGKGSRKEVFWPQQVKHLRSNIDMLAAGWSHCLMLSNGEVLSWGRGSYSPVKVNITDSSSKPVTITKIAAGGDESIGISGFLRSILGEEMKLAFLSNPARPPFSDVNIFLDDGSSLGAHRIILHCRAPSLLELITTANGRVSQTSKEGMLHFLVYLYSDVAPITEQTEEELLKLAIKFKVPRLEGYCKMRGMLKTQLSEDYNQALYSDKFSDIAFIHGDRRIPAHRCFLAIRCKYFETMFASNMLESNRTELPVSDMDVETLEALLEYIYTDKITCSPTVAIELLSVANQYQIPRLQFLCEGVVEKGVEAETVCYVYKAAKLFEATNLVEFCLEIITSEWAEVSAHPTFEELLSAEDRAQLLLLAEKQQAKKKASEEFMKERRRIEQENANEARARREQEESTAIVRKQMRSDEVQTQLEITREFAERSRKFKEEQANKKKWWKFW